MASGQLRQSLLILQSLFTERRRPLGCKLATNTDALQECESTSASQVSTLTQGTHAPCHQAFAQRQRTPSKKPLSKLARYRTRADLEPLRTYELNDVANEKQCALFRAWHCKEESCSQTFKVQLDVKHGGSCEARPASAPSLSQACEGYV